ncbi:SGNH/GDSL hydrolase family protein [Actinoplanes xinjiangensis]|uniref:Lysophospholipase L1-like esterase n=1 Tax=Actinoplanes xinjiangensis TaxID=512350 RepID=A0A316F698_9ACTN|nr:SGNH/GDSL hydrolase family protein [Actinoplanes xinjiangensis]PWK39770.1 lysophospholipase L1-like esterase [Actinoplanes xinjiangensis]GIF42735.1 SGNH hydrolase [Actinoplanes xinjiangensis]
MNTDNWVQTWGAAPQAPDAGLGSLDGCPPFADVTLRQVVRVSGGGRHVRLRLTNEYGTGPLTIGAARVGLAAADGDVRRGSDRTVTFAGRPSVTVPAGAPMLSDPIDLPLAALDLLSISLYLPELVESVTCHDPSLDTGWLIAGNAVAGGIPPATAAPLPVRALISAVAVRPTAPGRAVVVLSDSLADGFGSTPDTHRSWPELLAERLIRRGGPAAYVVNQGISGNRLLNDGLGTAGLARFDRDVLATPGLGHVVVSLGHNDISISFAARDDESGDGFLAMFPGSPVTPADVIAGYLQLIARAHERGVRVHATTLTPDEGAEIHTPDGEKARQEVNEWIRTSGAFDSVWDFDAVWRDPARPGRIRDHLHAGDFLHGNDAGYQALADSVDLSLFA